MADLPRPVLVFEESCRACLRREVRLPAELPEVGDDFDWRVRDYDGFRRFMLEDLAARFPERTRWTPADQEVVLVEAFAAALDQLSDMLDRVAAEGALETARRPESVYRLLSLVGYDASKDELPEESEGETQEERRAAAARRREAVVKLWQAEPERMEAARRAGPQAVHTQERMVSLEDYAALLAEHPLVHRAQSALEWGGAWPVVRVALTLWEDLELKDKPFEAEKPAEEIERLREDVAAFHKRHSLPALEELPAAPSFLEILHPYVEAWRMLGQEVRLQDAVLVGIELALSIRLRPDYFQSEVRREIERVLGRGPGGFFQPGRLRFGEDLHLADIVQVLMALDGVENVCVNRFKRLGRQFADESARGIIALDGLEIAVCDNDPTRHERGFFRLNLHGGRFG